MTELEKAQIKLACLSEAVKLKTSSPLKYESMSVYELTKKLSELILSK